MPTSKTSNQHSATEDSKSTDQITQHIKVPRWLAPTGLILSLLGIADTIYLTIGHYTAHFSFACPTTSFINCESVTTSSYSVILGVPVALLGLIFFIIMFCLQLPQVWRINSKILRLGRLLFSASGIVTAFWLIFVEFHRLHEICLYCTASHLLALGLFIVTVIGTAITADSQTE